MSWLARSLANSLKLDDQPEESSSPPAESDSPRGVKEDLSELTKTLTRQFWGVASFLAPPPSSDPSESPPIAADPSEPPSVSEQSDDLDSGGFAPKISGIRSDFAEIGGRFRTGISRLSSNKAVTEISKIASTFLPFGSEEAEDVDLEGAAVGVTEEVLAFARNISMHPETWLDFPLFADDEYSDDFDMSDAQQEHALAVERLAPRLAALRIELCPSHMSEECFWKIYFVLLHSRLNKHDADMLSTPQIVEARAMLLQELQSRTKSAESDKFSGLGTSNTKDSPDELHGANDTLHETAPLQTFAFEPTLSQSPRELETDKHPVEAVDNRFIDKSVIEEGPAVFNSNKELSPTSSKVLEQKFDEDGDDWLDEENTEMSGPTIPLGNEEDVSFSDLEDDEDGGAAMSVRTVTDTSDSSKGSRGWVELRKSPGEMAKKDSRSGSPGENKESNDWLNVEDIDTV